MKRRTSFTIREIRRVLEQNGIELLAPEDYREEVEALKKKSLQLRVALLWFRPAELVARPVFHLSRRGSLRVVAQDLIRTRRIEVVMIRFLFVFLMRTHVFVSAPNKRVHVTELSPNLLIFATSTENVIASVGPEGVLRACSGR
jgi:hypothetical protein